jgi:hypothetical protein
MVHTIDLVNSREIEISEEYRRELIFPAYEFHLCNCCEGHVQVYKVKFKAFKQAGRLQGVDVVMCLKGLINSLPMRVNFSLFPSVKEWQEHVKMCDNCSYFQPTPFVEMYEAYSHVSSCGICDQFSTKYGESTFSYATIEWCDRNEVYEPTIENLGDTWADKVQPNHARLVLDILAYGHNGHTVKGIHVSRMAIGHDVVGSGSLFLCNVEIIIRWRYPMLDLAKVKMMLLYSSVLRIAWDPGKFNVFMFEAAYESYWRISHGACIHMAAEPYDLAVNEVHWRMLSTVNQLLNFVFDRGKTRGMRIDVKYRKWDAIRGPLQGRKLRSFVALMSQVEVCQQRNSPGLIEKDIWSLSILVKLLSILSSLNKFIPSWFSDNLMTLLVVRRAIIITSNLEGKVDYKGVALIGPMII